MKRALPLLTLIAQAVWAQSGHWEGAIKREGPDILFSVDLDDNPEWHGSFSLPGRSAPPLEIGEIMIDGPAIQFAIPEMPGQPTFKGTLAEEKTSIKGTVTQSGAILAFEMRRLGEAHVAHFAKSSALDPEFRGDWFSGSQLVLHLLVSPSGETTGTLDSTDRRTRNLVVSSILQNKAKLSFAVRLLDAKFDGELSADRKSLRGTWTQGAKSVPMLFQRAKESTSQGPRSS